MTFYLTMLNLVRFLKEKAPKIAENEIDQQKINALNARSHIDFLCHNYILNGLDDTLYNIYAVAKTAKELWSLLEKKYKMEDVRTKKFIVGRFLDFKIVDSKKVIDQVHELQLILYEIQAEGMQLSQSFQVATMIEKLLPLWKDFKSYLKHKRKDMSLENLIVRLRIEKDNQKSGVKQGKATS